MRSRRVSRLRRKPSLAAEVADREEQIAHNKEIRAQVVAEEDARRIAGAEGHRQRTLQEVIQFEQVNHEQVAGKRQACDVSKNNANLAKQSGVSKNTQHIVKQLLWEKNRNL